MKKTITTLLLLSLSLRMTGQIDYLEPIKDYSKYKSELSGYYSNVLSLLSTGLSKKALRLLCSDPLLFAGIYSISRNKKR